MNAVLQELILVTMVLFCRIGGCMMIIPGFSSPRIPVQIRLFISIAITLVLVPVLREHVQPLLATIKLSGLVSLILSESLTGIMIGFMGRLFFAAMQFMMTAAASFAGFGALPGTPIDSNEPLPALASLIVLSATALMFMANLHWEVFRAVVASYTALPVSEGFSSRMALNGLTEKLAESFYVALRLASPFFIYGIIVNLAIGVVNKLTPQIPVYFISLPFVLTGGIFLLYFILPGMLIEFINHFGHWLRVG